MGPQHGRGLGWQLAFALLAVGPLLGIVAMGRLRGRPEALRMANGQRSSCSTLAARP